MQISYPGGVAGIPERGWGLAGWAMNRYMHTMYIYIF